MKRTQIYLDGEQRKELKKEAAELEISMSKLIRQLIENHIKGRTNVKEAGVGLMNCITQHCDKEAAEDSNYCKSCFANIFNEDNIDVKEVGSNGKESGQANCNCVCKKE